MSGSSDSEDERARARERRHTLKKRSLHAEVEQVQDEDDADERRMEKEELGRQLEAQEALARSLQQARIMAKFKTQATASTNRIAARFQARKQMARQDVRSSNTPKEATILPSVVDPPPRAPSIPARRTVSSTTTPSTHLPNPSQQMSSKACEAETEVQQLLKAQNKNATSSAVMPTKSAEKDRGAKAMKFTEQEKMELAAKEKQRMEAAAAEEEMRYKEAAYQVDLRRLSDEKERKLQKATDSVLGKAEAEVRARKQTGDEKAREIKKLLATQKADIQRAGAESAAKRAVLEDRLNEQRVEEGIELDALRAKLEEERQKNAETRNEMRLAACVTLEKKESMCNEPQILKLSAGAREAEDSACHRPREKTEKDVDASAERSSKDLVVHGRVEQQVVIPAFEMKEMGTRKEGPQAALHIHGEAREEDSHAVVKNDETNGQVVVSTARVITTDVHVKEIGDRIQSHESTGSGAPQRNIDENDKLKNENIDYNAAVLFGGISRAVAVLSNDQNIVRVNENNDRNQSWGSSGSIEGPPKMIGDDGKGSTAVVQNKVFNIAALPGGNGENNAVGSMNKDQDTQAVLWCKETEHRTRSQGSFVTIEGLPQRSTGECDRLEKGPNSFTTSTPAKRNDRGNEANSESKSPEMGNNAEAPEAKTCVGREEESRGDPDTARREDKRSEEERCQCAERKKEVALMEAERRRKLEEKEQEEREQIEHARQRQHEAHARAAEWRQQKQKETHKLRQERAHLDAELELLSQSATATSQQDGATCRNDGSSTERVLAAAREALGEERIRSICKDIGVACDADQYRRLWTPGDKSTLVKLEIIRRRLKRDSVSSNKGGPINAAATEPRPSRKSTCAGSDSFGSSNTAQAGQSMSPRRDNTWCWDSEVMRLKTPCAPSRTEPSPYSNIPAILLPQHARRMKRLIDGQKDTVVVPISFVAAPHRRSSVKITDSELARAVRRSKVYAQALVCHGPQQKALPQLQLHKLGLDAKSRRASVRDVETSGMRGNEVKQVVKSSGTGVTIASSTTVKGEQKV